MALALAGASPVLADANTVRVVMSTSEGDIGIDLYLDQAPVTAGNFLQLVEDGSLDGVPSRGARQ